MTGITADEGFLYALDSDSVQVYSHTNDEYWGDLGINVTERYFDPLTWSDKTTTDRLPWNEVNYTRYGYDFQNLPRLNFEHGITDPKHLTVYQDTVYLGDETNGKLVAFVDGVGVPNNDVTLNSANTKIYGLTASVNHLFVLDSTKIFAYRISDGSYDPSADVSPVVTDGSGLLLDDTYLYVGKNKKFHAYRRTSSQYISTQDINIGFDFTVAVRNDLAVWAVQASRFRAYKDGGAKSYFDYNLTGLQLGEILGAALVDDTLYALTEDLVYVGVPAPVITSTLATPETTPGTITVGHDTNRSGFTSGLGALSNRGDDPGQVLQ